MKLRYLFFIAFLAFASCSSEEDPETINPVVTKDLKEVIFYRPYGNQIMRYENNLIKESFAYTDTGTLEYESFFSYNDEGLLISQNSTMYDYQVEITIEYDNLGRIIRKTSNSSDNVQIITDLDYTQSGLIIANLSTTQADNTVSNRQIIYTLNEEGFISEIASFNSLGEIQRQYTATYENGNISSFTFTSLSIGTTYSEYYEYDLLTPVKGHYFDEGYKKFGDSKTNGQIYSGDGFFLRKNNYISSVTHNDQSGSTVLVYNYEFDEEGYPIKDTRYKNGEVQSTFIINYQ